MAELHREKLRSSPPRENLPSKIPLPVEPAPTSIFDLPAYPGGKEPIPNIASTSLIVEILAGAILGTILGGLTGLLGGTWLALLIGLLIGALLGVVAGMVVGLVTGPTGVLTGRNLTGAMVRVTLVTFFGLFLGIVGLWWLILGEQDEDRSG